MKDMIRDVEDPRSMTQKDRWEAWQAPNNVLDCVRLFFEILDGYEVSDNDVAFRPTTIGSCRVWDAHRLSLILPKMREMFEIKPPVNLSDLNKRD